MFNTVIENGKIVDGTGNVWYKADIGIEKDIIKPLEIYQMYLLSNELTREQDIRSWFYRYA